MQSKENLIKERNARKGKLSAKDKRANDNNGITLVALVVTIVVLLILAVITINAILGQNSIFDLAREAAEKTNQAIENEQRELENLIEYIKEEGWGSSSGGTRTKLADLVENPADTTKNIEAEDKYGNPITIPAGFHVVANSGTKPENKTEEEWNAEKVVYSYNGDGTPAVQDGIVIQDTAGNQFVWIPIGTIKNKSGDTNGATTTITLGRYEFDVGSYDSTAKKRLGTGEPTLRQDSANYTEIVNVYDKYNGCDFQELTSNSENTSAKNLEDFISKAKAKCGYYLARYEASEGTGSKVLSQANKIPWGEITQTDAATKAIDMYSENEYVECDLVNSYSWDTAIVFIQKYSNNSKYSIQGTKKKGNSSFNTGTSGDVVCNIHDMASNCWEWTTEHSTDTDLGPCVNRGGSYINELVYTAVRNFDMIDFIHSNRSFRLLLY